MPDDTPSDPPFEEGHFRRADESDDANFYVQPRLVTHIDDAAIGALRDHYSRYLPKQGRLLDLMSSWVSHYPDDLESERVAGLGMNAEELAENPQLTEWVVHDLNAEPGAAVYGDGEFDVVTIAVSVQYLTRPLEVFREIGRVLRGRAEAASSRSPTAAFRRRRSGCGREWATRGMCSWWGRTSTTRGRSRPRSGTTSPRPRGRSDPMYVVQSRTPSAE